jgi:ubiquinone/menaquinone biosynthesis C-methylase UbiE
MYDYFVRPEHVEYSINEAKRFVERYVRPGHVSLQGKSVLDISGGNGHFLKELFQERPERVVLTEINEKAIDYAVQQVGVDCKYFDFNRHALTDVVQGPFDVVLMRACIMFCADLDRFLESLRRVITPAARVVVQYSVCPTLGVLIRVQSDGFSYHTLRQPATVIAHFERHGFHVVMEEEMTDDTLYVYDDDLTASTTWLHYLYEIPAAVKLRRHRVFSLPARDRRRANFVFEAA